MDLFDHPDNRVPPGAVVAEVVTVDGRRLRAAHWRPERVSKGTVAIVQGRADFIEKYFETIGELLARGFAVAAYDSRGQGGSERLLKDPRKGYVEDFGQYDLDLDAFVHKFLMPECPGPFYALGHSTGGNILLRPGARLATWFRRMVLVAPFLGLGAQPIGQRLVGTLIGLAETFGVGDGYVLGGGATSPLTRPFKDNKLTSDPGRYVRNGVVCHQAPHLALGAPTWTWVGAAIRSHRFVTRPEHLLSVPIPVLMILCGADEVVSKPAIEEAAKYLRGGGILRVPGARHELLQETDALRAEFWAAFDAFVPGDLV